MAERIAENIQSADWKKEKHVPVIQVPDKVKPDEWVKVTITLGKEIAHPNTTEHHIRWIKAFFVPDGAKFAYDLGTFEFNAHGESAEGPNQGPVYTHHEAVANLKIAKSGVLHAVAYCNIHGLWESSKAIKAS